jgi:predicted nucleotidyltransferase
MNQAFLNLLNRLSDAGVEFVLVGGFAGVVHGCSLVTQDIDICCDFGPENLLRLQKAVGDLHPVHRMTPNRLELALTDETCQTYQNLHLDTDAGQLDCLSEIKGVGGYPAVRQASEAVNADGRDLHVLTLDALIAAKKAMNRPHDQEAVIQLEAVKQLKGNV